MAAAANLAQNMFGDNQMANGTNGNIKSGDIPIQHLDYEYINTCSSGKELEKILKVLRSGKEGRWPDLERHCENKLAEVYPKSKVLRVATQLLRPGALDEVAKHEIDTDISSWLNNMSEKDDSLKKGANLTPAPVPEIRHNGKAIPTSSNTDSNSSRKPNPDRINSYDYRAWDKYNTDIECEKIEKEKPKVARKNVASDAQKPTVHAEVLGNDVTKAMGAEREKEKGNEAFKAGDFEESVTYYTNSLEICPLTATYNNRGLAKLKLERYVKAIEDFNAVLEQEPDNVKALLRRADAYEKISQIKEAHTDLERSVIVDETNKRAKQLLDEFKERHKKLLTKGGKRMKIIESSDEEAEVATPTTSPKSVPKKTPTTSSQTTKDPTTPSKPTPLAPTTKEASITTPTSVTPPPATTFPQDDPVNNQVEIIPLAQEVLKLKEEATLFFTTGNYVDAVDKYTACINKLDKSKPGNGYQHSLLLSNRAACKLKMGECSSCVKDCSASLEINPRLFKSVLRRAIAYENLENYKKAYEDYRLTIIMEPSQITAQQGITRISKILQDRYGSSWREHVSSHSSLPTGAIFVDKMSTTAPQSTPTPSKPGNHPEPKKQYPEHSSKHQTSQETSKLSLASSKATAAPSKPYPAPTETAAAAPKATELPKTTPAPKTTAVPKTAPTPKATELPKTAAAAPKATELPKTAPVPKSTPAPKTTAVPKATTPTAPKPNRMPTREEQYAKFKDQGNKQVSKQDYREAIRCYEKCVTLDTNLAPAHLNMALCYLKLNDPEKAIVCTDKVLSKEPHNIKALYRRATANKELNNYAAAAKDLKLLVDKDHDNKEGVLLLDQVKKLWSAQLRGMQQSATKQPASAQPKGKKIPIVTADSDSESDDEKPLPKPQSKLQSQRKHQPKQLSQPQPKPHSQPKPQPNPKPTPKESAQSKLESKPESLSKKEDEKVEQKTRITKKRDHSALPQQPTAFSFLQHWTTYKKRRDIVEFAKVLEACELNSFPKIFSSSIDADMVLAIVDAVDKYFIPNNLHQQAIGILQAVTKVQRFEVMTLLMNVSDKTTISNVISKLDGEKHDLQKLLKRFV